MMNKFVTSICGIDVYGVISITLFVSTFVGVLIWAFSRRKEFLNNMSALPLEDGEKNPKLK